jgi:hypothetical protein
MTPPVLQALIVSHIADRTIAVTARAFTGFGW